jgi:hypothetical protein
MSKFLIYQLITKPNSHLFNSQIERLIFNYCKQNDLILPDNFSREHYQFYSQHIPESYLNYSILFLARQKTSDELLREQIEFQIQHLEK